MEQIAPALCGAFTPDVKPAWADVYGVLSRAMIGGTEPLPKAA